MSYRSQSTAIINVTSFAGSPTVSSTITIVTKPACGIPAAPMLAAVAVMLQQRQQHKTDQRRTQSFSNPPKLPDSDKLSKAQIDVADLSDEYGGDCFVQRRSVHVDRGADRHHETSHPRVYAVSVFEASDSDR